MMQPQTPTQPQPIELQSVNHLQLDATNQPYYSGIPTGFNRETFSSHAHKHVPNSIYYEPMFLGEQRNNFQFSASSSTTTTADSTAPFQPRMDYSNLQFRLTTTSNYYGARPSNASVVDGYASSRIKRRFSLPSTLQIDNPRLTTVDEKPIWSPSGENELKNQGIESEFQQAVKKQQARKEAESNFLISIIVCIVFYFTGLGFLSCMPFYPLLKYRKSEDAKINKTGRFAFIGFLLTLFFNMLLTTILVTLLIVSIVYGSRK
ncbi:hypothetical protein C9374_000228 [Naegleria lovaniensis]|uniref:Uncharacterized protein n=1 Tax=Naegleria lovaniensis TaxID=51637 RepID=A0AA88H011_NAELO|nr:uncharacterized protein C9374_000228 [Naegleria lovaniensis]KAG2388789.1 hypothetical protein C9374_000228 [Naegleria lovaniensis]